MPLIQEDPGLQLPNLTVIRSSPFFENVVLFTVRQLTEMPNWGLASVHSKENS